MAYVTLYPNLILEALGKVRYPGTGKDLVSAGMVEDDIRIDGNKVSFSLIFDKANDPFIKSVVKAAESAILTYISEDVDIKGNISVKSKQAIPAPPAKLLPGVKNIIAGQCCSLARKYGRQCPDTAYPRCQLGRVGLLPDRYASGNERHPPDTCTDAGYYRSRCSDDTAGRSLG